MKNLCTLVLLIFGLGLQAQSGMIEGQLVDEEQNAVAFANVVLYRSSDSALLKAEATTETGLFRLQNVAKGNYFIIASFVGAGEIRKTDIEVTEGQQVNLGVLVLASAAVELEAATVTATRVLVEVKPDRTVFNVQGTINSTGDDGISLLRKAPGVTVDNNDNINVLGRSGVIVYVDGKRLPLNGDDLSNYLKNLTSDQIDRIDIISNPGARYDAEGNAGIIDIHLKKDKNHGANGTVQLTSAQGRYNRSNVSASGNYRDKKMNVFATLGAADGTNFNTINFLNYQNDLIMDETNFMERDWQNYNYRLGTDFFVAEKHTIGFLVSGMEMTGGVYGENEISIQRENVNTLDSLLVANSSTNNARANNTFNINYRFDDGKNGRSLNIDLDYGSYRNESYRFLPNIYYADETKQTVLTEVNNWFETPTDIGIYTAKADYEDNLLDGKLSVGAKASKVVSSNTFLVFDEVNDGQMRNDSLSNIFDYDETVLAGYVNYARHINKKLGFSAGLRAEWTDVLGDLQAFLPSLVEPPFTNQYLKWFPSLGVTWQVKPTHALAFNYGRRINRPDYDVLNPFNNRLSEISYQKGNPRLNPEIVNNAEIGYTFAYRYNFKLAYSKTLDQITRLIGPDQSDPRSNFITWENLAEQRVFSFNASLPVQVTKKWNAYFNLNGSHIKNEADYGNGAVVDVKAFSYNIYTQQTFDLPAKIKGEVSGWFSGPGIWGGVFLYKTSWSLNLGLQRKFLEDRLNVKLSMNDIFYKSGWRGVSSFNGLVGEGNGNWDSRFFSASVGYNFGNQNVKSRKRKTGIEDEAGRVGN